ncbi:MAG: sugar kinase [Bacteroidaceae bacterium]|nr:sugar kinase [Bacteroidaceae bacterium]
MKVVTFGEIMLRLGAPDYLRLNQCSNYEVSFAGAEANVAVSLANYGVEVDYVTALPNNPVADKCLAELRGAKVNVDNVVRCGERIGVLYLETGSVYRPSRVFYDRAHSSIATLQPGTINWENVFNGADWFHWTGITPALSQSAADVLAEAITVASKLGLTISCDINYRGKLWQYGKSASDVMPALVEQCDIILGNEEDCEKVFGIKPKDFDAEKVQDGINPSVFKSVCSQMMERFPRCKKMVITLRGAINANHNTWAGVLYDGHQLFQSPTYNITDIVDRVGGGDSFMGALIYGLRVFKDDDQHALNFAVAASCLKHTIKGDYNQVTVDEVESLVNGNTSGRVKR